MPPAARKGRAPSYDIDELQAKYPSLKHLAQPPGKACERSWVAAFTHKPEALENLLSDIIKQAYAQPGRIGQRPMPKEEEVNLEALIYGEYSEEPLPELLKKMVKMSDRAFAQKIHISRRMLQRIMLPDGDPEKYFPDMELMQRIAKALGKTPSYFLEYRVLAAQAAFVNLLKDRPGVATKLYRDWLEVNKKSPFLK